MTYPPSGAVQDSINADLDQRVHVLEIEENPALAQRVTALEEADETLTTSVETLQAQDAATQTIIAGHGARLDGIDVGQSYLLGQVTTQSTRLDGHDTTLASQANGLTSATQSIATLGDTSAQQTDSIVQLASSITQGAATTAALAGRTTALESGLDIANSSLDAIATEVSTVSGRTDQALTDNTAQQAAIESLAVRLSTVEGNQAAAAAGWPGTVLLSSFAGADSTAKLRAALTYVAAQSDGRKPAIILPPGTVLAPGSTPFMLFNGAAILGGTVPETEFSLNSRVQVTGAAPNGVFDHPNDTRSVVIANIGWEGPGLSQVCRFMADGTNRLNYSLFSGVSFDNFTSVLRKRFLGFLWQGSGYCNNSAETPFEFSGSDYKVFMDGYYLDSPNLADTDYLLHIKSGNKVTVGEVFVTGDGPTPVRVSGGQMVRLRGLETEAEGIPRKTAGASLFVSGGNVIVDNLWSFRTMVNPSATGRGDNGALHVEGAGTLVRVKHATFGEYNNDFSTERPGGYTYNHVYAAGSSKVYLDVAQPWNMQANSGTGGTTNARALQVGKAGTAQVFASSYAAL